MDLIIGGAYNSKLSFALNNYNLSKDDFQNGDKCLIQEAFIKKGIYNLHSLIRRMIENGIIKTLEDCDKVINHILSSHMEVVICNEVGSGIIPIEDIDCKLREYVGKILIALSESSRKVIRIYYGIPQILKG